MLDPRIQGEVLLENRLGMLGAGVAPDKGQILKTRGKPHKAQAPASVEFGGAATAFHWQRLAGT